MPINEEQITAALNLFNEQTDLKSTTVSYDRFCNLLNVKSNNELTVLFGIFGILDVLLFYSSQTGIVVAELILKISASA